MVSHDFTLHTGTIYIQLNALGTIDNLVVTIPNSPPSVNTIPSASVNEGDIYSYTGSFTDPDSMSWTGTVDYGDGTGLQPLSIDQINHTFTLSHNYQDSKPNNAAYTVSMNITDNQGAITNPPATAQVTVHNVAPHVDSITASVNPVQVNTSTTASTTFSDPGVLDAPWKVTWYWGDGDTSTSTVSAQGAISVSHSYANAGVYEINVTVSDKDGATGQPQTPFQYLSVYNPTPQGLFSAGQKYTSPAGSYRQNTSLTGNVLFGLSYKYQGTVPTGNRQFSMDFNAANFHFNATTISSLVISNGIGTLTGTGTLTSSTNTYNFLVTGSESANTIRIQITDPSNNNNVIYDTQYGDTNNVTPTTTVIAGNVLAH